MNICDKQPRLFVASNELFNTTDKFGFFFFSFLSLLLHFDHVLIQISGNYINFCRNTLAFQLEMTTNWFTQICKHFIFHWKSNFYQLKRLFCNIDNICVMIFLSLLRITKLITENGDSSANISCKSILYIDGIFVSAKTKNKSRIF